MPWSRIAVRLQGGVADLRSKYATKMVTYAHLLSSSEMVATTTS